MSCAAAHRLRNAQGVIRIFFRRSVGGGPAATPSIAVPTTDGYPAGLVNRGGEPSGGNALNGDGISMKSPRINTDGAMPTIW